MKIDAHQHFWEYDPKKESWMSDDMSVIKKDFAPKDLDRHLKDNGFEGCVTVQADTSENENKFLLSMAARHDFIKGVVGWLDLKASNLHERLEYYCENPKFAGIRHTIQSEEDGFMTDKKFIDGVAALKDYNLTYDILIAENQLEEASKMIDSLPEMNLVIDHIAKPDIKGKSFSHWAKWMKAISEHPNVFVKISGLATEADWNSWNSQDFKPYIDFCLEKFGADRLMIGSDWPVCLLAGSYEQIIEGITSNLSELSESEKTKIMGENATGFYDLKK